MAGDLGDACWISTFRAGPPDCQVRVPDHLQVSLAVEDGVWCSLKATVEDLFLHADFLVVRVDRRSVEMVESENSKSDVSFKEHTKD